MADTFPTLGFLACRWIYHHCTVPSGYDMGTPFAHRGWQVTCTVNHYRIREGVKFDPARPVLAPAFHYRRSVIVGPQKSGKSPWAASVMLFEAAGPCLFAGWASGGEVYRCDGRGGGCACGWEYPYAPGEPMGMMRPKSLVQILATAETQTANVYEPMQTMIRAGVLVDVLKVREGFIRTPSGGKVEPVSAAARSKLGNPINAALGDESGLYTRTNRLLDVWQTMRRNVAGMGGRSIEITNPWDPMEGSAAQLAFESRRSDIFRHYRKPPADLSYRDRKDRHRIHAFVYADAPWVDVRAIDSEAAELVETDPTQSERFFGNRLVQGLGSFMPERLWDATAVADYRGPLLDVALGFDGSRSEDWTALRAETPDGYRFTPTYGPDNRPTIWDPARWGGRIPRGEVAAAVDELFTRYHVSRFYIDPRHWETQADVWAGRYGEDVVTTWPTNQVGRMYAALVRFLEDTAEGTTSHDEDPTARAHALNARRVAKPGDRYLLGKPSEGQKIDVLMADVLAHEAAADARMAGWTAVGSRVVVFR